MERLILVTTYMVITTSVNMIQGSVFDMYDEDKIICKAYLIERNGHRFAFYKTYVGAPITVGLLEDSTIELDCTKYVLFGGAGCLDKEIAHGKVMIPTAA